MDLAICIREGKGGTAALLPTALDPPDICYINVSSVVRA